MRKLLLNRIVMLGLVTFTFCTGEPELKTTSSNVSTAKKEEVVADTQADNDFQDFIDGIKKRDTLDYKNVDKGIHLKSFLKEDLPGYIVVVPPKSNTLDDLDGIHTKVGFWLMERGKLFNGTFYDVHLILKKREIVFFHLFNHKSLKNEILYYKSNDVLRLLYGEKAEEKGFHNPGDSLRRK